MFSDRLNYISEVIVVMTEKTLTEVIGLFPAGGRATRISPLPLSKELYPIGFQSVGDPPSPRPKVVGHYLLEKMRLGGANRAYCILRPGKWDIPNYFGDGGMIEMPLGYLIMTLPHGVPYTLDQAYPFVTKARVLLGFPDILFQPEDAFTHLLQRQEQTEADVVLGLFKVDNPQLSGMVDFDATGRVHTIIEKPQQTDLTYSWIIAAWGPTFTEFMHQFLRKRELQRAQMSDLRPLPELPIGDVIQAGLEQGLRVESVTFPEGRFIDIGNPQNLLQVSNDVAGWTS